MYDFSVKQKIITDINFLIAHRRPGQFLKVISLYGKDGKEATRDFLDDVYDNLDFENMIFLKCNHQASTFTDLRARFLFAMHAVISNNS